MVLHHAAFSFAVALFIVAGNLISSHLTLTLVFGMDLAQSSSAAGVSDRAIKHGTESNMAAACGNRWLIASWVLALQALDGLDFVFLDRTEATTWLAITWALVFELVETWLCPFRFTWL